MPQSIPFIIIGIGVAGLCAMFGDFWGWFILAGVALMVGYAFMIDWWDVRSGFSGWFDRLVTRVFGPAQIMKDQDKDDKFILKKGYHS